MLTKMKFVIALPLLAVAQEWQFSDSGASCAETCEAEGLECDNDTRLTITTFDKVQEVMQSLGQNCLTCDNGCKDGGSSGPTASTWQGNTFYCSYNDGTNNASCGQSGSSGVHMICACKPSQSDPTASPTQEADPEWRTGAIGDFSKRKLGEAWHSDYPAGVVDCIDRANQHGYKWISAQMNGLGKVACYFYMDDGVDMGVVNAGVPVDPQNTEWTGPMHHGPFFPTPKPTMAPTQGKPLVPKPNGEPFTVRITECDENETTRDQIDLIWTDECQPDPMDSDTATLKVSCTDKPGAVAIQIYEGTCAEGELQQTLELVSGECQTFGDDEEQEGQKFIVSQWVVDHCTEQPKPACCRTRSIGTEWADEGCKESLTEEACNNDRAHKCAWGIGWNDEAIEGCEPEPTPKPTKNVPVVQESVTCYSLGDPHFKYFDGSHADFQNRGEFTLWETDGLQVQVRQGPHLTARHVNTVSTNNGFAIKGDQTCGHLFEIYAENGGSMKVTRQNGQVDNYTGVTNIMTGLSNYNCPSISTSVGMAGLLHHNPRNPVAEFMLDHSRIRLQIESYGINIWVEVEGAYYLDTDNGICTKRDGAFADVACEDSLFSVYGPNDCPGLERREIEAKTVDDCPTELRQAAEEVCNKCPKVIAPEDCVLEVCALGDVKAADKFLEACDMAEEIAPKRDVHCSSVGDPHFRYFDGTTRDFQDRGEFTLYEHGQQIKVQVRQGARPDLPNLDTISTNHAAAIGGQLACGHTFEFYYEGPKLKVTKNNGDVEEAEGQSDIESLLSNIQCDTIATANGISAFSFGEGDVRVRVQLAWYGINVWVDVKGEFYDADDNGICTKRDGAFDQLQCRKSLFSIYKNGEDCDSVERKEIEPATKDDCDATLLRQAKEVCGQCPDVIAEEDCITEACAIGTLEAAQELMKGCKGGDRIIPDPKPLPAPKRDVTCASLGDPHMKYFDGTGGDFQSRGEFVLYKTNDVTVQVRQGVHLTLSPTHPAYGIVSTNNAFAIHGDWTCGIKYEVYADSQKMLATENGQTTTSTGLSNILADIAGANCPTVNVNGNIVEFSMANKMKLRFQVQGWGINIWIDLKGDAYLDTDTGICTKRDGGFEAISCDESIFSEYPEGDCDRVIKETIDNQDVECDPNLKMQAQGVCNECPDVVSPTDCVFEACALKTIDAAHSLLKACKMNVVLDKEEKCGENGKMKKKGAKKVKKTKTDTPCECANFCENHQATDYMFKAKKSKCICMKGVRKMVIGSKYKNVVGKLAGSIAVLEGEPGAKN